MLLLLLVTTGLRKGEALGLRWEDVDLEAGVLWVRRQWTYGGEDRRSQGYLAPTKSRRERKVPLPRQALEALRRYREQLSPLARPEGWVFPSLEGRRRPPRPLKGRPTRPLKGRGKGGARGKYPPPFRRAHKGPEKRRGPPKPPPGGEGEEVFRTTAHMDWRSFVQNRLPLLRLPEDLKSVLEEEARAGL